ncbi:MULTISPECIES: hypothetical protein [unclassified Novosphingobium]|uniref:hypothetical protein n=1 Tax=unclassified Novosphingobium TaxID=2644732 RepID=UPI00146BB5D3|nr:MULTISPECIES: hypothetical protein [unclassified Novosphingobium]NMN06552.1 hypothetical protein [Novosphingobium sp. SG919]NMN88999.1 hypothetical protein [Novosphingobium sp. SG916]
MSNERNPVEEQRGPAGDAIPTNDGRDARTAGGQRAEPVEKRPSVSQVTPEDYPLADRKAGAV